jgi:BirA family biotin operon repressor/biotin-[acetyl-CoA-carboxylase] ligase
VVNALESLDVSLKPMLKWPNDIQINSQKIGGILIDVAAEAHGHCKVIIGLGINVNMKNEQLDNIDQPWTSLEHILNRQLDRNIICVEVIKSLLQGLEIFSNKGLTSFLSEWKKYDLLEGKKVVACSAGKEFQGLAQGVNQNGHFLVELSSGKTITFSSGDIFLLREQ